jgi:two-component system LytT family response regulator
MLRTILIDDEVHVRKMISDLIGEHFPAIEVIAEADGVQTGIEAIRNFHPDLVLLDIKMQDGDGFDLLNSLETIDFKIIFITAYSEFAVKAFRFSAVDYLLKPVSKEDIETAFARAENQIMKDLNLQLSVLSDHLSPTLSKKLILRTSDKIYLTQVTDIIRCESDMNYSTFYLTNNKKILVSSSIKVYDEMLKDAGFFRIHKSHLVNLAFVESYVKGDGGFVILSDSTKLPVSVRKKNKLLELFKEMK